MIYDLILVSVHCIHHSLLVKDITLRFYLELDIQTKSLSHSSLECLLRTGGLKDLCVSHINRNWSQIYKIKWFLCSEWNDMKVMDVNTSSLSSNFIHMLHVYLESTSG